MKLNLIVVLLFVCSSTLAQERPYFQQEVNYIIDVKLDDVKHELNAVESIEYINNSPDDLKEIYMHIWPNAYRDLHTFLAKQFIENGETKFHNSSVKQRGYIDQLEFQVNGVSVKWAHDIIYSDVVKITLNEDLRPGGRITITTPFHVKIPEGIFSRLGHMGQSYQITQWYPKPAVYDRNGWNYMPYLNQGEFYSEFGTFDVAITLPKNYVVGATGDLVNGEQELEWLDNKVKATQAISKFDTKNESFPISDTAFKTLRFKQSNVHDFAWFADKRYHVLKGEVELPQSKRKVTTWVMFTNAEAHLWKNSIEYMNDAIYYYSLWNGDYPYNQCTAVDGALSAGGGMEYPNVTVIGRTGSAFALETVIMHEVGHNWFYGILGSNERAHPWMDEGLNSFNELRYIRTKYPERRLIPGADSSKNAKLLDLDQYKQKAQYELMYLLNARRNMDQPCELAAQDFTQFNYGAIVYSKTAIIFDYLMGYIGEEAMNKALHNYFEKWKFKHPQPQDLRKAFEESTGKDLSWLFDDLINTTKKLDYKIKDVKNDEGKIDVTIKNTGEINGPFSIYGLEDGKVKASIWYEGFEGKKTFNFIPGKYDSYRIDANLDMPEITRKNNTYRSKGLFRKIEPLRFQLLGSIENPDRTQISYLPIMGWNNYNKFMAGIAFYNNPIPQKKFEYVLAPMYAFGTKDLAGTGELAYNLFPDNLFRTIRISASYNHYAIQNEDYFFNEPFYFDRIAPKIDFELKKKDERSPIKQNIIIRSLNIWEDRFQFIITRDQWFNVMRDKNYYSINNLIYKLDNKHVLHPYSVTIDAQQHETFVRSSITANYRFPYKKKKKGIDIRMFAGKFLYNDNASTRFGFQMHDRNDYLYDNIFLGRNEYDGILSQQFVIDDGGFKIPTSVNTSMDWLTSMNVQASLPFVPLALFADAGIHESSPDLAYNAGVALVIVPRVFEIYFPVVTSTDLSRLEYGERIRYTLNLNLLNPFRFARNFSM